MIYNFRIIDGKWEIGNLNDKLVSASFDHFVNRNRQHAKPIATRSGRDLKQHNYKFRNHEQINN